jgi:hypothetical protein
MPKPEACSLKPLGCLLVLSSVSACAGALPPTGLQRGQQTAQDFNMDARFGRSELVINRVAPEEREEYALHHRAWGSAVRVADLEIVGTKARGDADFDVFLRVSWYRMDEQDLKSTTVKQSWHSKSDDWLLSGEQRLDGDLGLLGEAVVVEQPAGPRAPAQYPTIRLGESAGD